MRTLYRYRRTTKDRDRADVPVVPGAEFELSAGVARFADRIPPASVSVYTTYQATNTDVGMIAD